MGVKVTIAVSPAVAMLIGRKYTVNQKKIIDGSMVQL